MAVRVEHHFSAGSKKRTETLNRENVKQLAERS